MLNLNTTRRNAPKQFLKNQDARKEALLIVIATLFILSNSVALSLVVDGFLRWQHFFAPILWFVLQISSFVVLQRYQPSHDPYILPVIGLLTGWGLLLIDRLAPGFLVRQAIWLLIGMPILTFIAVYPGNFRFLRRYRYTWLIIGLCLLGATFLFGVNPSGRGANLWLKIPFTGQTYFQPSELLKILLIVFLASYLDERGRLIQLIPTGSKHRTVAYLGPLAVMLGLCLILLVWQQDLGAAALFIGTILAMLYIATGDGVYVIGGIALLVGVTFIAYHFFDDVASLLISTNGSEVLARLPFAKIAVLLDSVNDVVSLRIDTWLDPWSESATRGYQIIQSLFAVATGGLAGQGIGQGNPLFIPVVHSDFAFAAVAEEWGLLGTIVIVGCFALITYRGLRIAVKMRRPFRLFLASGITIVLSLQAFLIMGGVTKLIPLTGITLPFISYGGSSLLASSIMMGILLNLSAETNDSVAEKVSQSDMVSES